MIPGWREGGRRPVRTQVLRVPEQRSGSAVSADAAHS